MKFEIGGVVFPTKGDATKFFQRMLHSYSPGDRVNDLDAPMLLALLSQSEDAEKKIGVGIKEFKVKLDDWTSQCFELIRNDGTKTDFSYRKCLTPSTKRQKALTALRHAIGNQIVEFREFQFGLFDRIPCAYSGEMITRSESHVDHVPPDTFTVLVRRFMGARDLESVETVSGDMVFGDKLADSQFEVEWVLWHRNNAKLRVVSAAANMGPIRRLGT